MSAPLATPVREDPILSFDYDACITVFPKLIVITALTLAALNVTTALPRR
jgi:hypothetical protein